LHQLNVEHGGRTLEPISISAGFAVFPDHGETPEELLHAADSAMYQAKRAGRDRVFEYA
jgi:diguanylate cyclase (GGDEF)-like protein